MTKVLVLGAGGTLGGMVTRVLGESAELDVTATGRAAERAPDGTSPHRRFDVLRDSLEPLLDDARCEWIVNAVGVIKPRIHEEDRASIENAILVNAVFPHRLAAAAAERGQRIIQIATDGVFSGPLGPYDEATPHDPLDVYGKTKSLGEVADSHVYNLRCSIIGPESSPPRSLLGWALSAPANAELRGYTGQRWNGVTTMHFARLCGAIIAGAQTPTAQHVVPADSVSKAELLELALAAFGRSDVTVRPELGPEPADRTLSTRDPSANERLWRAAGYDHPPTIREMLEELAAYEARQTSRAR
ncbi:MAG TPA: sugar nucleotide-binding protein [Solirubrobacteraceae bacterium]